jgi:hypothetical protein
MTSMKEHHKFKMNSCYHFKGHIAALGPLKHVIKLKQYFLHFFIGVTRTQDVLLYGETQRLFSSLLLSKKSPKVPGW